MFQTPNRTSPQDVYYRISLLFFVTCKRNAFAGLGHRNSTCEHNPYHPGSREHRQVGSRQLTGSLKSVTTFFLLGVQFISFHVYAGYRSQFSSVGCT